VGCWWIKRAKFVLKFLLKSGQGLTPNPSPRGEGSSMLCWLIKPHPQPLSKGRGEWYALLVDKASPQPLSKRRGE